MFKAGRFNRAMKERWFVLYSNRRLAYYADKKESRSLALKPIAEIDLTEVKSIINDRSKDVPNKFVFELVTQGRTYILACEKKVDLDQWEQHLTRMIFGSVIHSGWLIKKGDRIASWRKRWFTLSDLKELRYYEDETQKQFKGTIDLKDVSIIRHGDKEQYGYEYTIEIITPDRTWVLVTTYHELRELWMDKLSEAMQGGMKMRLLYQGYLWKFDESLGDWTKNWYGIDTESMNLYYVREYNKFKQFTSTLFFDQEFYAKAVDTNMQGCLPIQHAKVEEYGNDDSQFDGTSQKSNPNIFLVTNVLGDHYFAADNEVAMKEFVHYLNLAIGGGKKLHIEMLTPSGNDVIFDKDDVQQNGLPQHLQPEPQKKQPEFIMDDWDVPDAPDEPAIASSKPNPSYHAQEEKNEPYNRYGGGGSSLSHRSVVKNQGPANMDMILQQLGQNQGGLRSVPPIVNAAPAQQPAPKKPAKKKPKLRFGPDGMPIMDDDEEEEGDDAEADPDDQPYQQPQSFNNNPVNQPQQVPNLPLGPQELELLTSWQTIIAPYKNNPNKLESEAMLPCYFGPEEEENGGNGTGYNQQFGGMQNQYGGMNDYYGGMNGMANQELNAAIHEQCKCVERVNAIIQYYAYWLSVKALHNASSEQQSTMGMSYLLSMLNDYSMTELLNDFFHLKRFHAEDIVDRVSYKPLQTYFDENHGVCPIDQCVSVTRNNHNYVNCKDPQRLRSWYYIDAKLHQEIIGNSLEFEEITTQQILDMIHCYIHHGCHFSLYDTTPQHELEKIKHVYSRKKPLFLQNRYITNVHQFHHIPYKPMDMGSTPQGPGPISSNPLLEGLGGGGGGGFNDYGSPYGGGGPNNGFSNGHYSSSGGDVYSSSGGSGAGGKYNDIGQMYEYTAQAFGVDQEHNQYQRALKMYGPARWYDFKQEVMQHPSCGLSVTQFNIICLKASILLSTIQGKMKRARSIHDSASTFQLDPKLYRANEYMSEDICQALLIYCHCEQLRCELINTYFKVTNLNETDLDCRRRHYSQFYHFGKLMYTAIIAFGTDIYEDSTLSHDNRSFMVQNKNSHRSKQKFFYHNVSKPLLFTKFNTTFFAPTSCSTSRNIATIHMPIDSPNGIVLELDTNNVSWTTPFYLDISMFGPNPAEMEQLFAGGASLGIHNIVSMHSKDLTNLSNYTAAITLLRYIIGDTNNQVDNVQQSGYNTYANQQNDGGDYEWLDEFDQNICRLLTLCIDHQVDIYKNNKNINELHNLSSEVPLYIALLMNSWCSHKQGIIQLNMSLLKKLPKPLQHQFVYESMENQNDYSINWSVVFNLFPNCNKVWKRGLYFNNFLCEQYVNFLCSEHITNKKYKMDGIVFSCTAETDWKKWVTTAKKHSSIIKQMGWLITASPPKRNAHGAIETGRVSFIKRVNNK